MLVDVLGRSAVVLRFPLHTYTDRPEPMVLAHVQRVVGNNNVSGSILRQFCLCATQRTEDVRVRYSLFRNDLNVQIVLDNFQVIRKNLRLVISEKKFISFE